MKVLAAPQTGHVASAYANDADFQTGYATGPAEVAANVELCVATGVAGLSIEDAKGDKARRAVGLQRAHAGSEKDVKDTKDTRDARAH